MTTPTPTGGTRPPHWTTDVVDTVRAATLTTHDTAGNLVRWIIVFVALTPFVFAGFALPSPEFARAVVPGVTLVALIVTVLLFAFRWNQLVAGLVELGIITTLVSKVKKPQALGSLAGAVKDFGTATLRWTSKVIGLELLIGIYFSLVPVANERVLILVVLMLMAAIVFLTLGKVKRLAWIPIILLYVATVVFFNGGIDESIRKYEERQASAQTTSATEQSGRTETVRYLVELRGDDILSDVAVVMEDIPPGTTCPFEGPTGTQVHFDDGTVGFITGESFGVKSGPVRFTGPAGEMAGLVCTF